MSTEKLGLWFTIRETTACLPSGGGGGVGGGVLSSEKPGWTDGGRNLPDAVLLCFCFVCFSPQNDSLNVNVECRRAPRFSFFPGHSVRTQMVLSKAALRTKEKKK